MGKISPELRAEIAKRHSYRCSYCQSQTRVVGALLTIDHIIPESLGGQSTIENLCLACWDCNLIKGARVTGVDPRTGEVVRLFHPNRQRWEEHFRWSDDGLYIVGLTPIGRATVTTLDLNRPQLVIARRYWVDAGWHPPPK